MQPAVGVPRWSQLERLGAGTFGLVFRVRNQATGNEYAAKVSTGPGKSNDMLKKEIQVHSRLTHPNIIQYVNSFDMLECGGGSIIQVDPQGLLSGNTVCICMLLELANGGELHKKVKPRYGLPAEDVRKYGREVVGAMIYLKEQGILHRDIKLENILLHNGVAKLADFGFACFIEEVDSLDKLDGTPLYFAPEMISSTKYSFQSDVWALGCVMYGMIEGRLPFNGRNLPDLGTKVLANARRPFKEDRFDSLGMLLMTDPNQRVRIENVLHLDFFNQQDADSSIELPDFKRLKMEFGDGTREAFYMYLAGRNPDESPMSMNEFNDLYDRLY